MPERRLTAAAYARARSFLLGHARRLEVERFRFHFEQGSAEAVRAALAAFQNPDGGFGRALEPDLRAAESSAIATSVAFQILREVRTPRDDGIHRHALAYLVETWDASRGGWRIVPTTTDDSPHAPWWQQAGRDHDYDAFGINPNAELLGVLLDHRDTVPPPLIACVQDGLLAALARPGDLEMHDLLCCLRLERRANAPTALAAAVRAKVLASLPGVVGRDRAAWVGYGLRPLQVADAPDSPYVTVLGDTVEANLDHEIETQEDDGAWLPLWSWGEAWPEAWAVARREWAGILTLQRLRALAAYGRIEGREPDEPEVC